MLNLKINMAKSISESKESCLPHVFLECSLRLGQSIDGGLTLGIWVCGEGRILSGTEPTNEFVDGQRQCKGSREKGE